MINGVNRSNMLIEANLRKASRPGYYTQEYNQNQTDDKHKTLAKKKSTPMVNALEWAGCIGGSLLFFATLIKGINSLTSGGLKNSYLHKLNKKIEDTFQKTEIYDSINSFINKVSEKISEKFNNIKFQKYKTAMSDKDYGNKRISQLACDIFQVKTELKQHLNEEGNKFKYKDLIKSLKGKKEADEINKTIDAFKKKVGSNEDLDLLLDKFALLKRSKHQTFLPKILTKIVLAFENASNTSLPMRFDVATLKKMAFPIGMGVFATAPTMKKTIETDEPNSKKFNTIMKDLIINNALMMIAFSFAGRIVNSITGLKTLGTTKQVLENGSVKLINDKTVNLNIFDKGLKAIGQFVGMGQGYEFSLTPKGIASGLYGVIAGMGIRVMLIANPLQECMLHPFRKGWDTILGKAINMEGTEKKKAEIEAQKK